MRSIVVKYKKWLDSITVLSLCSLIFTLPFSKSAVEISFTVAFIPWVLKKLLFDVSRVTLKSALKQFFTGINPYIFLFIFMGFMSMCFSNSLALSLRGFFFKLLKGVLLLFMLSDVIDSRKRLDIILATIFFSMILTAANGVFQLVSGTDFIRGFRILRYYDVHGMRMRSSFSMPQGFGGWLTFMIPIALSMALNRNRDVCTKIQKSMPWILLFVLILCMALTRSEGAWLGLFFGIIFFASFKSKKLFLFFTVIIIITSLLAATFLMNVNTFSKGFLLSLKNQTVALMLLIDDTRTNLWREALLIIRDFPIFGCGLNTYSIVAPRYKSAQPVSGIYPHNSYLQMAAETGIAGLASFLLLIAGLFIISLNSMKKIKDTFYYNVLLALLAGLFGFLIHSFFDVNFYALQLSILMWFIMGLIIAVQKIGLEKKDA
jgi:O-antigen ligase